MSLTINNLPLNMHYRDIKELIREKCGITNINLWQLMERNNGKSVTVSLKDNSDSAILMRNFNGMYLNGNQLFVEHHAGQHFGSGMNAPNAPTPYARMRGGLSPMKAPQQAQMGKRPSDNFSAYDDINDSFNLKRPFYQINNSPDFTRDDYDEPSVSRPRFDEPRFNEPRYDEPRYDEPRFNSPSNRGRNRNRRKELASRGPVFNETGYPTSNNVDMLNQIAEMYSPAKNQFQRNVPFPNQSVMRNNSFSNQPVKGNNPFSIQPLMGNNQFPAPLFLGNPLKNPNNSPISTFQPNRNNLNLGPKGAISYPPIGGHSSYNDNHESFDNIKRKRLNTNNFQLNTNKQKQKDFNKYQSNKGPNNKQLRSDTFESTPKWQMKFPPANNKNNQKSKPNKTKEPQLQKLNETMKRNVLRILRRDLHCKGAAAHQILSKMKKHTLFGQLLSSKAMKKYVKRAILTRIDAIFKGECDLILDDILERYRLKHDTKTDLQFLLQIKDKVDILSGKIKPEQAGKGVTPELLRELNAPKKAKNDKNAVEKPEGEKTDGAALDVPLIAEVKTTGKKRRKPKPKKGDKNGEWYHLPPKENEMLEKELKIIEEKMLKTLEEVKGPKDPKLQLELKTRINGVIGEAIKVYRDLTVKRLLNVNESLLVRLEAVPKFPEKDVLNAFLDEYDVVPKKRTKHEEGMVPKCRTFEGFDNFCALKQVEIDGCTINIKPFQIVHPRHYDYSCKKKKTDTRLEFEDTDSEGDEDENIIVSTIVNTVGNLKGKAKKRNVKAKAKQGTSDQVNNGNVDQDDGNNGVVVQDNNSNNGTNEAIKEEENLATGNEDGEGFVADDNEVIENSTGDVNVDKRILLQDNTDNYNECNDELNLDNEETEGNVTNIEESEENNLKIIEEIEPDNKDVISEPAQETKDCKMVEDKNSPGVTVEIKEIDTRLFEDKQFADEIDKLTKLVEGAKEDSEDNNSLQDNSISIEHSEDNKGLQENSISKEDSEDNNGLQDNHTAIENSEDNNVLQDNPIAIEDSKDNNCLQDNPPTVEDSEVNNGLQDNPPAVEDSEDNNGLQDVPTAVEDSEDNNGLQDDPTAVEDSKDNNGLQDNSISETLKENK